MTTSVQSTGVGVWILVAIPAVIVTPTAPTGSPITIQIESYELQSPSQGLLAEDSLAALYADAALEDRALAAEGCATWDEALGVEDDKA
jgi:hypothetical protein